MFIRNPFKWPLYLQTLIAIALGILTGMWAGREAGPLGILGKWVIQLIMTFATPLLFLAILESIVDGQIKGKGVFWMAAISLIDACFAVTIALGLGNYFAPGRLMHLDRGTAGTFVPREMGWERALGSLFPESLLSPFVNNSIPGVIVLALLGGLAFQWLKRRASGKDLVHYENLKRGIGISFAINLRVIEWVVRLTPLAVFGSVAKVVGENGFGMARGLGAYVLVCAGGMALQVLVVYQSWIWLIARKSLRKFWEAAKEPVIYSFGVNSSLAMLPITLTGLDQFGVSRSSARLSACVGSNLKHDGILLYEVAAALFIAQANGIELDLIHQLGVAAICVAATIGVAGIPEAGIISLSLVLTSVGLPPENIPILLAVDWMLARLRSVTNVLSDMTVAVGIDAVAA